MTAVTPADNPACNFDQYNIYEGKCCPCTASPCHPHLDLILNKTTVTDNEGLGLSTDGCNFTTFRDQHLLFFARRWQDDNLSMVNQLIGITNVMQSQPAGSISDDQTVNGIIVGVVLGVLFIGCTVAAALAVISHRYVKTRQDHRHRRKGRENSGYHWHCSIILCLIPTTGLIDKLHCSLCTSQPVC